jgi:hypothetical protein
LPWQKAALENRRWCVPWQVSPRTMATVFLLLTLTSARTSVHAARPLRQQARKSGDRGSHDADRHPPLGQEQDRKGKLVIIDTEGKTNDELTAALFAADIAVVPVHLAMDDITAAHQLVNGHIPLVAENRGFALPVMYVFTNNTVIDKRARALADLREIIQQDGTRIASEEMPYRIAYKDMQTGNTLYSGGRMDPKAIAESEAVFAEIVEYVIEANQSAAAE